MTKCGLYAGLLFCAVFASAGPKPGAKRPSSPPEKPSAAGVCALLTGGEIERALGGAPDTETPLPGTAGSPGGCIYHSATHGAMLSFSVTEIGTEAGNVDEAYASLVRAFADQQHLREEPVSGLGTRATHLEGHFVVLVGRRLLVVNYSGAAREDVEPLVRRLVAQLA